MPLFEVELKYTLTDSTLTSTRLIECAQVSGAVEAAQSIIQKDLGITIQPTWVHVYAKNTDL